MDTLVNIIPLAFMFIGALSIGVLIVLSILYFVQRKKGVNENSDVVEDSSTPTQPMEPIPQVPPTNPPSLTQTDEGDENLPFPFLWMAITFAFFTALIYLSFTTFLDLTLFGGLSLGELVIGLLICYLFISIKPRAVGETEMGVISFFGRPVMQIGSGPALAPPGIVRVISLPVGTFQRELPAPKELIELKDDVPLGPGMKRAIRVMHPVPEDAVYGVKRDGGPILWKDLDPVDQTRIKADPLGRRAATEIIFNLRLRIRSGITFIRAVGDMDEALRQAEDALFQAAQSILGTMTPGYALTQLPQVNEQLRNALEILTGERPYRDVSGELRRNRRWGVDIQDAGIKELSPGHRVNAELAERNAALAKKDRTITDAEAAKQSEILAAEGTKQSTILQAEGTAKATTLQGDAEAGSLKARGDVVKDGGGRAVLVADMLSSFDKSRLIVASGEGGLTGLVAMATNVLDATKKEGTT